MKIKKSKLPSRHVSVGVKSAPHRSMYYAMGLKNVLVVSSKDIDQSFIRAAKNIMNVDVLPHQGLNVYDIVKRDNLIIFDDALRFVEERLL